MSSQRDGVVDGLEELVISKGLFLNPPHFGALGCGGETP